jgi:hypothetical protein
VNVGTIRDCSTFAQQAGGAVGIGPTSTEGAGGAEPP